MGKYLMTVAVAAFCGSAAVTGLALSSVKAPSKAAQPEPAIAPDHPLAAMHQADEAASMEAWAEAATTGPAHAWLGHLVGTWKTSMSINMGPEPMLSEGTAEIKWLLEGRFLIQEFHGDMMGMPMDGFGISGFDNLKRQYVGTWVDSMGTAITTMMGSLDPSAKILTQIATMDEPTTGEHGKAYMYITTLVDEDHFRFEAREILYGDPFTVFTIEYTRAE